MTQNTTVALDLGRAEPTTLPDHETTRAPRRRRSAIGRRLAAAGVAVLVGALIAGCGGDDDDVAQEPVPSTDRPSASSADPPSDDAVEDGECPLTDDDVSAVVGVAVTDIGCAWTSDSGGEDVGPDDLRVDVFYSSYPASLFSTYRQQAADRAEVADVEGLGDEAYTEANSGLSVLAGDRAFSIHVAAHGPDPDLDLRAAELELAHLIIDRQA